MNALLIIGPVVYGLVVLVAVALCKAASRGDDTIEGWRNRS